MLSWPTSTVVMSFTDNPWFQLKNNCSLLIKVSFWSIGYENLLFHIDRLKSHKKPELSQRYILFRPSQCVALWIDPFGNLSFADAVQVKLCNISDTGSFRELIGQKCEGTVHTICTLQSWTSMITNCRNPSLSCILPPRETPPRNCKHCSMWCSGCVLCGAVIKSYGVFKGKPSKF